MITNTEVFGIESALRASQFPMLTDVNKAKGGLHELHKKLGSSPSGEGHDCFLKGIIVKADIRAPEYFWAQFSRYHFADIVSSQSKMHRIHKMEPEIVCNEYVSDYAINAFKRARHEWLRASHADKAEAFQRMVANCPMGFERTASITTNYLQLKTMYKQRKHHKIVEWKEFCEWCESLPHFKELVLN